jgi:murein DD-endopeptidase MepM/ murein hydrolase activator NlpD
MFYFAYMLMKKYLTAIFIFTGLYVTAQKPADYPKDYFRNPLDIPIVLAGNFGECRPNHFHSGLDIKTGGKENMAVYAAADGYISRIKMERGGFGHALYVTHPNGYTTLYAHLNKFMPAVQEYMVASQYKKENWEQDIALEPTQFPVKKGEQIAWSGNTGSSTAPHLHFEIRNAQTEHPLNPQLFGFDIKDNIAPKPTQIALYNMSKGVYEQIPAIYELTKKGENYTTVKDTVIVTGEQMGVAVNVNDYMNGSDNTLTYYTAALFMNDAPFIKIKLDDIGYDVTRYMHAFIDYKTKKQTGDWLQCLFQMDGNRLDNIYEYASEYRRYSQRGRLEFADDLPKTVRIELTDAMGNATKISFIIKCKKIVDTTADNCDPANKFVVYKANKYYSPNIELEMDDKSIYEGLCFAVGKKYDADNYSARYEIHKNYVPVHTYFSLRIKPDKAVPLNMKDKVALVYNDGKDETGKAATLDEGWYKAQVRNFGEYRLVADKEPPVITPPQNKGTDFSTATEISIGAKDAITSVKKFTALLDGKWICFEQKGDVFVYTFDEHCPKGKHVLAVTAIDENNNKATLKYNFTR